MRYVIPLRPVLAGALSSKIPFYAFSSMETIMDEGYIYTVNTRRGRTPSLGRPSVRFLQMTFRRVKLGAIGLYQLDPELIGIRMAALRD